MLPVTKANRIQSLTLSVFETCFAHYMRADKSLITGKGPETSETMSAGIILVDRLSAEGIYITISEAIELLGSVVLDWHEVYGVH